MQVQQRKAIQEKMGFWAMPQTRICYLEIVDKRDEETLTGIIVKCLPTSASIRIVSDGWASYSKLKELGYQHVVVFHEKEFVNNEGYHASSIESIWSQIKSQMSSMHAKGGKASCFVELEGHQRVPIIHLPK